MYTELCTRISVTGKQKDEKCENFDSEIFVQSLDSLYTFFQELRGIMRKFPVGRLKKNDKYHLGILINNIIRDVLRPSFEKWQSDFRHWYEYESNKKLPPFERQSKYPKLKEFLSDWTNLRLVMVKLQRTLTKKYKLVKIS